MILFSKRNHLFLAYFRPVNKLVDNENEYFSGGLTNTSASEHDIAAADML